MHRGHGPVVAGRQREQHVECLAAAHLTHDETVGPESKRSLHQIPNGHFAEPIGRGPPGFEPNDMGARKSQLCSVFDRNDPFVTTVRRKSVQQARLAR